MEKNYGNYTGGNMNQNEYAEALVKGFIKEITDQLFLYIQHNDSVMRDYMTNVNRYGLDTLNMAIGEKVKTLLNLENDGVNDKPKSNLIKTYSYHKLR
jgi:hypothetical protein